MNLEHKRLSVIVVFTLLAVLCAPVLVPSWHIAFCVPMLVVVLYQKPFVNCLWWALLTGLLLDCLSANTHLGLYAISFSFASLILYTQRRNFFADSITTLPLMTFFFSVLATVFQFILMYTFEQVNVFSWAWVLSDLIYLPLLDALYAFIVFVLPGAIFGKRMRPGNEYFF